MDEIGASLVAGRSVAKLGRETLVLRVGRQTTRIPIARVNTVDTGTRSLAVHLHDGSTYEVRGPSQTEVDNFAVAVRTRIARSGGLTTGVPEVTTEVQGSNGCSALVYGYGGTLTAYSVALNLIGGPERLVYLLPVGIFSLVAVMFSFGFLQGALKDLRHRSWPKVTGTVLKGGPRNSPLQVVYLVAGGHEQRSTVEIDSTDRWISDGRPVRLRYDPENPAVAHSPSGTVSKVFSFVVAAGTTTATVVYAAEGLITDFGS